MVEIREVAEVVGAAVEVEVEVEEKSSTLHILI
jgi:hypothetical protein